MEKIKIYLTNLGRYVDGCLIGEWVKLPISEDKLAEVLARIGINAQYEEYFISDYESLFSNLHISEHASITELNELAEHIEELADFDYDKLGAILECDSSITVADILAIIDELDSFDLIPDVEDDAALGDYYAEVCCIFHNIPDSIQRYFDYEA